MSTINYVALNEDGSGILHLTGVQKRLYFNSSPHDITYLNGRDIQVSSNIVLLNNKKIANREGYTKINFIVTTLDVKSLEL